MDTTKSFCRDTGYVETLFGRRCHYPRIRASNPSERANMERAAVNAPIQGTAADIIRRAMVRMDAELERAKLGAQMLLQVHDELVFEVPHDEVEATIAVVRAVMVDAPHPAVRLSVPLQVDAKAAGKLGRGPLRASPGWTSPGVPTARRLHDRPRPNACRSTPRVCE